MAGLTARRIRRQRAVRWVVVTVLGIFFLLPLLAMLEFTTRGAGGTRSLATWRLLLNWPKLSVTYPDLAGGILASFGLVLLTVVLMLVLLVPTVIWVRLRLPGLRRVVEFVCLLPLTIPAIVLVVGLFPIYNWMGTNFSDSILTLSIAYVVLVLPYAYRSLEAGLASIDVKTLTEAARSLGAGWFTVMWRIIVPNISSAILNSAFLSVALVLGEYTIANNLLYNNLQVEIAMLGRANAGVSIAVAVASLLFAFVVLVLLSFFNRGRGRLQLVELQQVMRTERG